MNNLFALETMEIELKKSVPSAFILQEAINNLETSTFQVLHALPNPFNLRFTFFNDLEETKSIYLVLDVKNGKPFKLYAIAADMNKTFNRFELYADVYVNIKLNIQLDCISQTVFRMGTLNSLDHVQPAY